MSMEYDNPHFWVKEGDTYILYREEGRFGPDTIQFFVLDEDKTLSQMTPKELYERQETKRNGN